MNLGGRLPMSGRAQHQIVRNLGALPPRIRTWRDSMLLAVVRKIMQGSPSLRDDVGLMLQGTLSGRLHVTSVLSGVVYRMRETRPEIQARIREMLAESFPVTQLPRYFGGDVLDCGVLSTRLVTTAGVNFLVDAWQGTTEMENLRYHGFGTGTGAEATGDTALGTELTTQYATDNTRPTGTLTEGASANIFRTVGTLSPDTGGTIAVTEHGIFSQAATGGGTLWDRSVFSAVNLVAASDSLQTTYDMTASAGG